MKATIGNADNAAMDVPDAEGSGRRAAHAEQRRHGRVRARAVTSSIGPVLDLSASGMRVLVEGRASWKVGQRLVVTLKGEGLGCSVALRPVWIRSTGSRSCEMGCCFEDVDESTRVQLIALVRASVRNLTSERE